MDPHVRHVKDMTTDPMDCWKGLLKNHNIYIYKMNINLQKNREMRREKEDTTRGSTVLPARSTAACLTSLGHERQELARLRGDRDKI